MTALSEEQRELQKVFREVFRTHCPVSLVRDVKAPESSGRPEGLWRVLRDVEILGLAIDEEFGGSGASLIELGLVYEEAGRVLCPTALYSTLAFGVALSELGDDDQKHTYLGAVSRGEIVATTAISDPSDARNVTPRVRGERCGEGWKLYGELMFVSNGVGADVMLVTASTASSGEPERTLGFLVTPGGAGWSAEPMLTMAGDKQARIVLDGYLVRRDQTLAGPEGAGMHLPDITRIAETTLALQCCEMLGGAAAVLDRTVEYVKEREQFGRPLGSFQAVQHHVADMTIALEKARVTTHEAISRLHKGSNYSRSVAIAKMLTSETYKWITLTAHQLHGAMGYVRETDLHLWSERAKVAELVGGSADVAAGWLAEDLKLSR